ncbi:hypothetical protein BD770DRAFT_413205 [Pilaira anomala]|nr:hypothetical protein BD770DRAFT_413205 [Pilaira anomala]
MISRTVFRANMHLFLHVPNIIHRMGPLCCLSSRSRKEALAIFNYLELSGMVAFEKEEKERNALTQKVETKYYFARVLFFFSFQYNSDGPGSHFFFAEMTEFQEAAYFNTAIPTVSFVKAGTANAHITTQKSKIVDKCEGAGQNPFSTTQVNQDK